MTAARRPPSGAAAPPTAGTDPLAALRATEAGDAPAFVRQRAQLIDAALAAAPGGGAELAAFQAEIDQLRALQPSPGRVIEQLVALLAQRVGELGYWAHRLECEADAAARAAANRTP